MADPSGDNSWSHLSRRTLRGPLLSGTPRITALTDGFVLRSRRSRIPNILVVTGFGIATIAAGIWIWHLRETATPNQILAGSWTVGAVLLWLFGAIFVAIGIYGLLQRGEITCDPLSREVRIRYGTLMRPREATLPARQLLIHLYLSRESPRWNAPEYRAGRIILALHGPASEQTEVRVATAGKRSALLPAFTALSEFLEGRTRDSTMVEVELDGRRRVLTSVVPASRFSASFATARLSLPTPDRAILSRSTGALAFYTAFLLMGCAGLYLASDCLRSGGSVIGLLLGGVVGGLFVTFGGLGLYPGFGIRRVAFDRLQKTISVAPGISVGSPADRSYSFSDVVAVQFCSKYVESSDSPGYITYELNLILTRPEGERLTLTSHAGESRVRDDARRLAEFLEKPLLDHTQEDAR